LNSKLTKLICDVGTAQIRWIVDCASVVDTIIAFANAIDAPDWQKLRSHLAGERDIDYWEV
jgi:hypothetical protein